MHRWARFYALNELLNEDQFNRSLIKLLYELWCNNHTVHIVSKTHDQVLKLDHELWNYADYHFIPHQIYSNNSQNEPMETPIILSGLSYDFSKQYQVLLDIDCAYQSAHHYQGVCHIFYTSNQQQKMKARVLYQQYKTNQRSIRVFPMLQ